MTFVSARLARTVAAAVLLLAQLDCTSSPEARTGKASATRAPFGVLPSGDSVHVFTLTNARGIEVRAIDYGGIILSLRTPDQAGKFDDIVLGYDDLAGYLKSTPYFGAIVGRYANRIAKGQFTLDGATYHLATNNGPNALHEIGRAHV